MDKKPASIRILAISNLFPNRFEPRRGLFNLNQFSALRAAGAGVKVVAPVPVFPGMALAPRLASSGRAAGVPESDEVGGMHVRYPRYAYVPVVGREIHGQMYYRGTRNVIGGIVGEWRPHVVYVTWTWPDAYAAGRLARERGLPYVVKVHGTDINEYLEYRIRRPRILEALHRADAVISVSGALRGKMIDHGIDAGKITVIYNGVDRGRFRIRPRETARQKLGLARSGPVVLFVGNLKPVKGLNVLIRAFAEVHEKIAGATLHVIGRGPLESELRRNAADAGLAENVRLEGEQSPDEVARWFNAADLLVLPSVNEGVPNVLLEGMSCGTPVVASNVGGIPEIVDQGVCGYLVKAGDPGTLADAMFRALARQWDRAEISRHTEPFTWQRNAASLLGVIEGVIGGRERNARE